MNPLLTTLDNGLGMLLTDNARLLRRRFDRRARVLGVTRAQWEVLKNLYRNEGINQAGMAELLEVEPITLCRQIDRMEEAGLVERRADPGDRRARCLYMTEKSWRILEDAHTIAVGLHAEALAGLVPDQVTQLMGALLHIRNNLSSRRSDESQESPS